MNKLLKIKLLIIFFSSFGMLVKAQNKMESPYYFCALNRTCFNQPPETFVRIESQDYSSPEVIYYTTQFSNLHPEYTIISPATKLYNCHGYAYSVFQGGEKLNIDWKDYLCSFNGASIESYIQISENAVQPGDIATIIDPSYYGTYSIHSSVVYNTDTLISKMGSNPLFKHYKYDPWIVGQTGLGTVSHYTYFRRTINSIIIGPDAFDGTAMYSFSPNVKPNNCTWSVEPAGMFQQSSGSGVFANLTYSIPFTYLAPKAILTFTFDYGCDNHYSISKEINLFIPTTTISGIAISDGFIIDTNATVTVTGEIHSRQNAKSIVPIGSRLVLNGGLMTSYGISMWPGIEVWGNSSANQLEVGGSYAQGYVEMRNGATVENAMCALSLWRPEHWGTTGGIVHAEDAVFRNNTKSVHALLYSNLSISGRELNYNSHFHNCSFSVDEDYVGTEPFSMHVHLYKVNGINFSGCSFSVDPEADGVQSWCSGIQADNAGVIVTSYCDYGNQGPAPQPCPDEDLVRSSFTGFHAGVKTTSDGTTAYPFTVRDSDFSYNDRGIYALNTGYGIILNNTFSIGRDADCAFGVYADRVTSFLIEENSFAAGDPDIETYGIGIFNSNAGNDVYLNSFDRLTCGNLAVGTNSSNTAHQGDTNYDGLTYTCNQNSSNGIDFCVLKDGGSGGVKPVQGSPSAPAGNTFDGSGFLFYNDGDWVVDYYYKSGDPDQTPSSSLLHRVNSVASTGQNNCLSHTGTVTKSPQEIAGLENDYLEARNIHANLLRLYESRIDGGSTAAEVADLRSATPSDQPRLRAKLLNHSPYLSQEALTVAADRDDVFSDPVLFEILAANPDELKKDTLISYLEHKASPLPTYMTDMLRMIAEGTTVRTTLVAQMDKYRHDWRTAAGDIVRSILNDSVADPAELRLWLGHMDDIASDRMAVASYVQEGDFGSAIGLAGTLPGVYGLDGDAVLDHRDYMRLLSLLRIIYESGRNTLQMTESELDTVTGIAESGTGTSQSMAQAMIESVTGTRGMRYDCPRLPAVRGTAKGFPGVDRTEIPGFCLAFSPNPVRTQATVDYTLPDNAEKAVLELFNALGVKVASLELEGNAGNKQISLEGLSPGIYSYSVRCGKHALNGKIVVE